MRKLSLLLLVIILFSFVGCSSKSYESYVKEVELTEVEGGVAYYSVWLTISAGWNGSTDDHEGIADYAIRQCVDLAKNESIVGISVMGFTSSGEVAFSWSGGNSIKYYRNDVYEYELYLSSQQKEDYSIS